MNLTPLLVPVRALRHHRSLLAGFIRRDIRGRFAGSFGGVLWTVLTPLATIITYIFVFSMVLKIGVTRSETGTDKFVVFYLCGFFPWMLFSESLSRSVSVLVNEASIITKVVFPVELLPMSSVATGFLVNSIGFSLFLIYVALDGYAGASWLLIPVVMGMEMLFALGLAFFLSALCVFIRDIGELLGVVLMVWFFATPILYPLSLVPEQFAVIYSLNPMVGFVTAYRDLILLNQVHAGSLGVLGCWSLVSYVLGTWFFMRSRAAFGDVL